MSTMKNLVQPDKRLAAVCGLFCPGCSIYIASHEDPERLRKFAEYAQLSAEDIKCEGCRSDRRYPYCKTCKMSACAAEKGLDFCGACEDFPCEDLRTFQAEMPHRIELWANQARIQEAGYETWCAEMLEHYACPKCGTLNSAYDLTCRKCGAEPGCAYVGQHKEEILRQLSNRK